jgi:hypothetical protein
MRAVVPLCAAACIFSSLPALAQSRSDERKDHLDLPVPLEKMPEVTRDTLSKVMSAPTINAKSDTSEFVAQSDMYQWLLDHPDRTAAAWRRLGVGAVEIKQLKDGRFFWKDNHGSELVWQTVAQGPNGRVWYAEGKVRPALLMPLFPVKAVAVLNHDETKRKAGDVLIKHQLEVYLQTDSKAAALVTKMLGDSALTMAQEGSDQLLMFFSGMARFAHDKPEKVALILNEKKR